MDERPSDSDSRVELSRERRRRINQAFRDGDLRTCLVEIKTELQESSGESDLLKALPKVQDRYITEVITPLIEEHKWEDAEKELDFVQSVGDPAGEVAGVVDLLRKRIDEHKSSKASPAPSVDATEKADRNTSESEMSEEAEEELWREAHAVLRQGEQAWAEGKKRQARSFVEKLNSYPIDDHDFLLRKDGLEKLLDESEAHLSRPTKREASAGKWVVVLAIILACTLIIVFLLDRFSAPEKSKEDELIPEPRIADSVRIEPDIGYIRISGIDSSAVVLDEDGGVIGRAVHVLPLPSGEHAIRIRSDGFRDTLISLEIAQAETIYIPISMRPKLPPRGWIRFQSRPTEASVVMESGSSIGTTPLDSVVFEPGRYTFIFKKPGYVPTTLSTNVRESTLVTVMGELPVWHDTGRYQLNARPWAYVYVNGDSLGPTPLTTRDMPTAIYHTFLFRAEDGRELARRLKLDPSRSSPTPVTVEFPEPGTLAVTTIDSVTSVLIWATIKIDERILGDSPNEFSLSPGAVTIRAERDGYRPVVREVTIKPGQRVTLTLALPPYRS